MRILIANDPDAMDAVEELHAVQLGGPVVRHDHRVVDRRHFVQGLGRASGSIDRDLGR
jgi:hypothetical protein